MRPACLSTGLSTPWTNRDGRGLARTLGRVPEARTSAQAPPPPRPPGWRSRPHRPRQLRTVRAVLRAAPRRRPSPLGQRPVRGAGRPRLRRVVSDDDPPVAHSGALAAVRAAPAGQGSFDRGHQSSARRGGSVGFGRAAGPARVVGWGKDARMPVGALSHSGCWRVLLCEFEEQPHLIDGLDRITLALRLLPSPARTDLGWARSSRRAPRAGRARRERGGRTG